MNSLRFRPKKRTWLHLHFGRLYFMCKRYAHWYAPGRRFCAESSPASLPYCVIGHESIFMRPLKNVDMYLQENKKTNILLAIERLDGILLHPGEIFSFWKLVGRPSRAKGYLEGLVLQSGTLKKGIGGGLCQLSNLIYWMTLHAQLDVVERWRHSYDVFPDVNRRLPFGSGATVAYNYVDLQIANPTADCYQLRLWQDEERLFGEWRCESEPRFTYSIMEKNHRIESHYWGGYTRHNELYRTVTDRETGHCQEELVAANDALMMYAPLLEA